MPRGSPTPWRRSSRPSCFPVVWSGPSRWWSGCWNPSSSREVARAIPRRSCSSSSRPAGGRRSTTCSPSPDPITRAATRSRSGSMPLRWAGAAAGARRKRSRPPPLPPSSTRRRSSGRCWTRRYASRRRIRAGASSPRKKLAGYGPPFPTRRWSISAAPRCPAWKRSRSSICWSGCAICPTASAFPISRRWEQPVFRDASTSANGGLRSDDAPALLGREGRRGRRFAGARAPLVAGVAPAAAGGLGA